jgi:hypothetical protein
MSLLTSTHKRSRYILAGLSFAGVLALIGIASAYEIRWLDRAYIGVCFILLLAFSIRSLFTRRSSDQYDITKHGPLSAYPISWRRWIFDDHGDKKN